MKHFLIFIFILSLGAMAKNRPYTEVIKELNPNNCPIKKENLYLSKEERKKIEELSEAKLYGGLALRYVVSCKGKPKKYLYVDSHIVRTLNETVVVKIQDEKIKDYIVASFNEPPEYKAPLKWLKQFIGKKFGKTLKPYEDIDALSGATLTVNSSITAVNKVLSLHKLLESQKTTHK
jgi:hypothetical protein